MASAQSRLVRLLTLGMVDLDRRDRLAWSRVFEVMRPLLPIPLPSLPAPVEPSLWAALLVDGTDEVACDLGAADPWPCHESDWLGRYDCPDVTPWYTIAERLHSVETSSNPFPPRRPTRR